MGDGKLQVVWPGLNSDIIDKKNVQQIKVIGEDIDREKKLTEIRNKMDKFRTITIPPHERGFTGSSLNGKSLGAPLSYDDGILFLISDNVCFKLLLIPVNFS